MRGSSKSGRSSAYRVFLAAAVAVALGRSVDADVVSSSFNGNTSGDYFDPTNWDPAVVPQNSAGTTYNVDISSHSVNLGADATIDNLSGSGSLQIQDALFTVNGTTSLSQYNVDAGSGSALASLGNFTFFDPATKSLAVPNGSFAQLTLQAVATGSSTATIQFNGADIQNNGGDILLFGANARVLDENGNDALRNLASNSGMIQISGRTLQTPGDLTNSGILQVSTDGAGTANTSLVVNGTLTNFDSTSHTLVGGTYRVYGGLGGATNQATLQFNNADIVHNAARIELTGPNAHFVDQFGNNALRNLADNTAAGGLVLSNVDFNTAGDFRNDGDLELTGNTFTIQGHLLNFSGGTLSGGTYAFSGSTLRFQDADIVNNAATIQISDGGAAIIDQNGNDGLRHFNHNLTAGSLSIQNTTFQTAGDFINDGALTAQGQMPGHPQTVFAVSGHFINTGNVNVGNTFGFSFLGLNLPPGEAFDVQGNASNSGNITIGSGATFSASSYSQTGGETKLVHGTLAASNVIIAGGALSGGGTVSGNVNLAGALTPHGDLSSSLVGGVRHGQIQVQGVLTLADSASANFSIGGTALGTSYDNVTALDSIHLGGDLNVALEQAFSFFPPFGSGPSFIPAPDDQFILLSAPVIDGSFSNATDGSRLEETGGYGSFIIEYLPANGSTPAEVIATDFQTPEPTSLACGAVTIAGFCARRRRTAK